MVNIRRIRLYPSCQRQLNIVACCDGYIHSSQVADMFAEMFPGNYRINVQVQTPSFLEYAVVLWFDADCDKTMFVMKYL